MKRILALVTAAGALALVALPAGAATTAPPAGKSIVAVAQATPQLSTLVKLVKQAGLVGALSGSTKLTVFAPTNAAFAKVPKATLKKLGSDKALLKSVLLYHVVKGRLTAARIEHRTSLTTLNGASVAIRVRSGSVYVNSAKVIKANVPASNGIVHVIDGLLTPPSG